MATIYLNNDNTLIYTKKSVIMQRSNLIDNFKILIPRYYSEDLVDMMEYTVYLQFITPDPSDFYTIKLQLDNENYTESEIDSEIILSYKIPVSTQFTSKAGKVEMWLTIVHTELTMSDDFDLGIADYLRKSTHCFIPITAISDFEKINSTNMILTGIDKRISEAEKLMAEVDALAQTSYDAMPTDIQISGNTPSTKNLHLINSIGKVGEGLSIINVSNSVGDEMVGVDPDGIQDGVIDLDAIFGSNDENSDNEEQNNENNSEEINNSEETEE